MKLKEWLHLKYGMTMVEFRKLTPEKQSKIRSEQIQINQEEQHGCLSLDRLEGFYAVGLTSEQRDYYAKKLGRILSRLEKRENDWLDSEDADDLLRECGVPFDKYGDPVGIWSDD